jgi:TFIIF-interacting CTD phosphatase-like protein
MKTELAHNKMVSCLLLDLDETLCHTYGDVSGYLKLINQVSGRLDDFFHRCYVLDFFVDRSGRKVRQEHLWGVRRPHLEPFLNYAFAYWDIVAVYTAGTHEYAEELVRMLFGTIGLAPHYIFSRDDCHPVLDQEGEVYDLVKPLAKLLKTYPDFAERIDLGKTVMIDNKSSNFVCNESKGLVIPDYAPDLEIELIEGEKEDTYLLGAIKHLEKRRMSFAGRKREKPWWRGIVGS